MIDTINVPKLNPNIYPESNDNNVANGKDNAEDMIYIKENTKINKNIFSS